MDKNFLTRQYLLAAQHYASFGTCNRLKVGAVVVDTDIGIIGTGFNTSLVNKPTCEEEGCRIHNESCVRTIHAEVYAIQAAIRFAGTVTGCKVYCTDQPCADCLKYMSLQGITEVYYIRAYRHKYDVDTDIKLIQVGMTKRIP